MMGCHGGDGKGCKNKSKLTNLVGGSFTKNHVIARGSAEMPWLTTGIGTST